LFGFIFKNLLVSKLLQTKVRPSGKRVLFRPKRESVTAFLKKVDTNGCAGFFQSFSIDFTTSILAVGGSLVMVPIPVWKPLVGKLVQN
jgi:hypothetical protein